jgi:predicted amidohydrolase
MHDITVALLQMSACGTDQQANLAKGEAYCRRARAQGADIALFPEMWNCGYTAATTWTGPDELWRAPGLWSGEQMAGGARWPQSAEFWRDQAVGPDDPFVVHFRRLAAELEMAIALTYLQRWEGAPRNAISLIDRRGNIVLTYAKVHLCEWNPHEATLTPGTDFPVGTLDTAHGAVAVGAMICFDRNFPESARLLMLQGAELILVPNACTLSRVNLAQFRVRAYENMVGVAMTNYAAPQNNGHSVAYDPLAFPVPDGPERDTLLVEAGEAEGTYPARFDLEAMRAYRRREMEGNAFRKPHRYGLLTSLAVAEPFVRVDAAGEHYDRTRR